MRKYLPHALLAPLALVLALAIPLSGDAQTAGPMTAQIQRALAGFAASAQTITAAWTISIAGLAAGPATAPNAALTCANSTAATVGTPAQWSPGCPLYTASGWDVDDAVPRTTHAYFTLRPISANTVTSQLQLMMETSPFSGTYTNPWRVDNAGLMTVSGSVVVGASGGFSVATKSVLTSGTNGLFTFSKNAGIAEPAVEMNMGTASPTVANCSVGTTGVVSAHSTNTAGHVVPGSGSTACDVVFGAPAFSFAPFITITVVASAVTAPYVSARSTTGFTVSGLAAGATFMYTAIGGT